MVTEHLLKEPVIITTDEHAVLAANWSLNLDPGVLRPPICPPPLRLVDTSMMDWNAISKSKPKGSSFGRPKSSSRVHATCARS